jgi:alanine dehydrogenase
VPRTSTFALANATFPYVQALTQGIEAAVQADPDLALGVNVWHGQLVCEGVAESLGLDWKPLAEARVAGGA